MRQMPMRHIHAFAPAFPYANEHRTKLPRPNGPYIAHRKPQLRNKQAISYLTPHHHPQSAQCVTNEYPSFDLSPRHPAAICSVCDKRVPFIRSNSMSPRRKPQPRKFRRKAKLRCVTNAHPSFALTLCHPTASHSQCVTNEHPSFDLTLCHPTAISTPGSFAGRRNFGV